MSTKRILSGLLALVLLLGAVPMTARAAEGIPIDEEHFPDANFLAYVEEQIDHNKDGYLSASEINYCTQITVDAQRITSLKGIEYFTALTYLSCGDNNLTSLDVSSCIALEYLTCNNSGLSSLDVSCNLDLISLLCSNNKLTTLDIHNNTELQTINCSGNQLSALDTSKNTELQLLICSNNQLSELDFSKNTKLDSLNCRENQLRHLDVSNCPKLRSIDCSNNFLTTLDVSNCFRLGDLSCRENHLTSMDISSLSRLETFDAYDCTYTITLTPENTFDLTTLPGKFDVSKAGSWAGGTVKGTILTVNPNTAKVTYLYDCGSLQSGWQVYMPFSLSLKLKVPSVTAGSTSSSGKPKLTWDAVDGAAEYQIYRATSKTGKYSLMKTTTSTSYTNTTAKTGRTYYYYVVAVAADGTKSEKSSIVSRTCDLAQPSITLTGISSTGKIKVSWKKIDGAVSYKVYRAASKNGKYTLVKTTTGTSYTNTSAKAGTTYYYKVKAIHEKEAANSAYSSYKSRTCDLPRPDVEITLKKGDPRLTWDKISGAEKYQIYRATSKDGKYTLMKTTTGTSYTNTSAKAGRTYYYKVRAVHEKSAANSAYSSIVSIQAK